MNDITAAQRKVLIDMGFRKHALVNGDECSPKWWIEAGSAVKANVAHALTKRGFVKHTKHAGGHPGVDYFTVTKSGRDALRIPSTPLKGR